MNTEDVLNEFRDAGALREGHFVLSSGLHSPVFLQKNLVFAQPDRCARLCKALAEKIVGDGEKITKVVAVEIEGARSRADAEKIARAIGNSLLVKSSWYGEDPNWGRLADAAGYARTGLEEAKLDIYYDDIPAVLGGRPLPENKPQWKQVVKAARFAVRLKLNLGGAKFRLLAADLTDGYVNYNKSE